MDKRAAMAIVAAGAIAIGSLGVNAASAATSSPARYQRHIDIGSTGAAVAVGRTRWEPQVGLSGGVVGALTGAPPKGLDPIIAKTVVIDPTAFALAVPNGSYRVTVWAVAPGTGGTMLLTEGVHQHIDAALGSKPELRPYTTRATVHDHALDISFLPTGPSTKGLQVAAIAISGRPKGSTSTTSTTNPPTTTTASVPGSAVPPSSPTTTGPTTTMDPSMPGMPMPGMPTSNVNSTPDRDAALLDDNDGEWQMLCGIVHRAKDDPIVFPNQAGKAHLHSFYGNVSTDAQSTGESLMASRSDCARGMETSDRSAYWVPSLMKVAADGTSVPELGGDQEIWAYYRRPGGAAGPQVQPFPVGLRMISGNAMATTPQATSLVHWQCGFGGPISSSIPTCSHDELHARIVFPNCWNGRTLDSPDHKSHMAFSARDGKCPEGFPVSLPELWIEADYLGLTNGSIYQLASGGKYSFHADFFAAWDPQVQRALIANCLNRTYACESVTRDGNALSLPDDKRFGPVDITKY